MDDHKPRRSRRRVLRAHPSPVLWPSSQEAGNQPRKVWAQHTPPRCGSWKAPESKAFHSRSSCSAAAMIAPSKFWSKPVQLTGAQSQGTRVASMVACDGKQREFRGSSTKPLKWCENSNPPGKPFLGPFPPSSGRNFLAEKGDVFAVNCMTERANPRVPADTGASSRVGQPAGMTADEAGISQAASGQNRGHGRSAHNSQEAGNLLVPIR
ncbi:hypothetical protein ABID21_001776 [Pseudorhizobium tarimense]|uniref:Uncharacterized protein n=1 Tax=Pseudorhizobium tarimense TaxID=1079109 RepID=A0ABV2H5Z0_9HYPH